MEDGGGGPPGVQTTMIDRCSLAIASGFVGVWMLTVSSWLVFGL